MMPVFQCSASARWKRHQLEEDQRAVLLAWWPNVCSKKGKRMRSLRPQKRSTLEGDLAQAESDLCETEGILEGYHILKTKHRSYFEFI